MITPKSYSEILLTIAPQYVGKVLVTAACTQEVLGDQRLLLNARPWSHHDLIASYASSKTSVSPTACSRGNPTVMAASFKVLVAPFIFHFSSTTFHAVVQETFYKPMLHFIFNSVNCLYLGSVFSAVRRRVPSASLACQTCPLARGRTEKSA